jgi:DnaJ-class molecular chaperone
MKPEKPQEYKCPACNGTGFRAVKQPAQPGRKIYPAGCERCDGKGWITEPNRGCLPPTTPLSRHR